VFKKIKHFIPFLILIVLIAVVYFSNIHHEFTLDNLRHYQQKLLEFVQRHPFLSPLIFVSFYIISVCLIIPDSTILTLLGGLVFPLPLAVLYAVFSETVGATIFFAIFHGIFGESLIQRERPFLNKMRKNFVKHNVSYLLFLRLSHILPFWLTNVCAAYFKVRYRTFIWTTLVGVIPLSYLLAEAGHSLSKIFATERSVTLADVFTTPMKTTLFLLGILALFPILYKRWRAK